MRSLLIRLIALLARLGQRRRTPDQIRRILLIKPDHLGDLLLATPALRVLRAGLPAAHITALVGPWARRIWQGNPDLDLLRSLPFPGFERAAAPRRRFRALLRPYLELLRYALLLRREHYDAAVILRDDHWWGAALAALAGIPLRIGQAHPLCAPLLTVALPYDPQDHVTEQALASVRSLIPADHASDLPLLRFVPSDAEQAWADAWYAEHVSPNQHLLVIHPGTGGPSKHWPEEHWVTVGNALAAQPATRLLLTGGPAEIALVARIAAQITPSPLTLAGATDIGQLAAVLGRAALVLGVDSGPLHLAVSQGVATIHLFGPSDERRFGPWGAPERHVVLRMPLACAPCGVFSHCPRHTAPVECMALIRPETLLTALAQGRHLR